MWYEKYSASLDLYEKYRASLDLYEKYKASREKYKASLEKYKASLEKYKASAVSVREVQSVAVSTERLCKYSTSLAIGLAINKARIRPGSPTWTGSPTLILEFNVITL
jgi:hypothetical protein